MQTLRKTTTNRALGNRRGAWASVAFVATSLLAFQDVCGAEQSPNGLSIEITGSRPHLAVGQTFSLTGVVTNKTAKVVYLNNQYIRLKVPMELEGPDAKVYSVWGAILPTAGNPFNRPIERSNTIALDPNGTTAVWFLWEAKSLSGDDQGAKTLGSTLLSPLKWLYFYLSFMPGSYQMTVTADYWADKSDVDHGEPERAAVTKTLDVAAPLWVIMIGAALGGLLGYVLLLPHPEHTGEPSTSLRYWLVEARAAAIPILFSEVITILWARAGGTVPLINISISDLPGGIAVGFLAHYLGLGVGKIMKGRLGTQAAKTGE